MRSPTDIGSRSPVSPRRRVVAIAIVIIVIILLLSLRTLAVLWTDQLWFSSLHISNVFSTLLEVKIGLAVTFGILFFLVLFGNLLLVDRFGARDLSFDPDDELVRRFQDLVRPYARRVYALIAVVAAAVAGFSATSEWKNYILFANARSFHRTDPLFHKDLGFYIFRLPFLSFLVSWAIAATVAVIVICGLFHYLNGGIRTSRVTPRVAPQVKVHLSVLLAVVALLKALGYVIARWELVTSGNGYVEGAGYADVHARMPALTILIALSLAAAVILLVNIRNRGWSLPLLAVGLWAFVALVIGVIYPSILQAVKVNPAQSTLELPYIQRNIGATRDAFNLNKVITHQFSAATAITQADLRAAAPTLNNIRLWDPSPSISLETVQRRQSIRSYYTFTTLGVDRYYLNGKLTPVLIGARQLNTPNLPSPSWVNQHLIYTHGVGAAILAANAIDPTTGNPVFAMGDVPPISTQGMPTLTQPGIYFGINLPGYVVANSKQKELDYQINNGANAGTPVETHYTGTGGVGIGGLLRRTALSLRFGDFTLLISNQVTSKSRILFVRDVQTMAEKAAPFLSWDKHPYAIVADGHVKFVLDGYTTTDQYPYSENAGNQTVPGDTGLPGSYNYVRNSVKLVVDAYNGSMDFYAADPNDPILQAYRGAFPNVFKPMSSMPSSVRVHLRYPTDLLSIQAATIGRYHITSASSFYSASDRWEISPTNGAGSPNQTLSQTNITDATGAIVASSLTPMDPTYEVMSLPGTKTQQLTLTDVFVPAGNSSTVQSLTSFITASSDPNNYGQLNLYIAPRSTPVTGPVQADSYIQQNATVSKIITPLDQHGSHVLLGNNLIVPLDNTVLYIRPLYVTSSSNPLPQLKYVIAVFNQNVGIEPTLAGALLDVLGANTGVTTPTGGGKLSASTYLHAAAISYANAQTALKQGDLAAYQKYVTAMNTYIQLAQSALSRSK